MTSANGHLAEAEVVEIEELKKCKAGLETEVEALKKEVQVCSAWIHKARGPSLSTYLCLSFCPCLSAYLLASVHCSIVRPTQ